MTDLTVSYVDGLRESMADPQEASAYLRAAMEDGNQDVFLLAIQDVLASDLWNSVADRMEYLEDIAAIYRKKWELAAVQGELIELSPETLAEWMNENLN